MNISLTTELETWIQQKVASGYYQTSSEVVREALRTQIQHEQKLEELKGLVEEGWRDVDIGRTISPTELKTRLQSKL